MKKKITMIVCVMGLAIAAYSQEAKPKLTFDNPSSQGEFKFEHEVFDFGKAKQGDSVYHEFVFTNVGKEPILIERADKTCGCYEPHYPKQPVKHGEKGIISVTFNTSGKMGMQDKTITLKSNAKQDPMIIHLKGTVEVPDQKTPAKK